MMSRKVIIASQNSVKINAVKTGFTKMFPLDNFTFQGVSVSSNVKDQPMNNKETIAGSINRAKNAKKQFQDADYWVGIEGGIEKNHGEMEAFAWVVIESQTKQGKARTGTFYLPQKVITLINNGKELGEADDIVFGNKNSKQKNGAVGILTGNIIVRTRFYSDAVILALIPFKNPGMY